MGVTALLTTTHSVAKSILHEVRKISPELNIGATFNATGSIDAPFVNATNKNVNRDHNHTQNQFISMQAPW